MTSCRDLLLFAITDKNFTNLVGTSGQPYHPDSVKIINTSSRPVGPEYLTRFFVDDQQSGWIYTFRYLQGEDVPDLRKYHRTFYLQLTPLDIDTILVKGFDKHTINVYFNGVKATINPPSHIPKNA